MPDGFLQLPVAQWEKNEDIQKARKSFIATLPVINYHTERGVNSVQKFFGQLTMGEEQLQFVLQFVAENLKIFPNALKKALSNRE